MASGSRSVQIGVTLFLKTGSTPLCSHCTNISANGTNALMLKNLFESIFSFSLNSEAQKYLYCVLCHKHRVL